MDHCFRNCKTGAVIYSRIALCHTEGMATLRGARDRARAEITTEILNKAREHLELEGAAGLSLRAVARDLELVPSAVYRYFENRDALLTALIVDAYNSLGEAVEASAAKTRKRSPSDRWIAAGETLREWALTHRHEYALLYGSPVPGYAAPQATVGPGTRISRALVGIVADAGGDARLGASADGDVALSRVVRRELADLAATLELDLSVETIYQTLLAWTQVFGLLSFEVFGQTKGVLFNHGAFFRHTLETTAARIGL
jgi:AcrR family transcriptional regulator